jgi:hypothetical protein
MNEIAPLVKKLKQLCSNDYQSTSDYDLAQSLLSTQPKSLQFKINLLTRVFVELGKDALLVLIENRKKEKVSILLFIPKATGNQV